MLALFSVVSVLAVLAAIPVVSLLSLGYLLEAEGRIARTRRWSDAVPLQRLALRFGTIFLGVWLWLWPLRLFSTLAINASIVSPEGSSARNLDFVVQCLTVLIGLHLCLAIAFRGQLVDFFRPLRNARWFLKTVCTRKFWFRCERRMLRFVRKLRLGFHFLLGLRGFFGALLWLVIPTALLAATRSSRGFPVLITILGGTLLVPVLYWIPFLQARFAASGKMRAFFELSAVRQSFHRAPIAWSVALIANLVLTLPLFLAKVRLPPNDLLYLVTPLFIVTIYPARLITGWAYGRAVGRTDPVWWGWSWLCRSTTLPIVAAYVVILFFTQFIDERGKMALFEHHAFLLPVPL